MNRKWLVGLMMPGLAVCVAGADVLDDAGITEVDFARAYMFPNSESRGQDTAA